MVLAQHELPIFLGHAIVDDVGLPLPSSAISELADLQVRAFVVKYKQVARGGCGCGGAVA